MLSHKGSILATIALAVILSGCGHKSTQGAADGVAMGSAKSSADKSKPDGFLKWSMDQYHAAPGLEATCAASLAIDGKPVPQSFTRSIYYATPNRFKVQIGESGKTLVTCVSDGSKLVEYTQLGQGQAMNYPAPAGIAEASDPYMKDPMRGAASLVYQFFEGSGNYQSVVNDEKGPVTFGEEGKASNGEPSRVVKFYGRQNYGHVQMLIGENTGYVYQVDFDGEPFVKMITDPKMIESMRKQGDEMLAKMPPGPKKDEAKKRIADMLKVHSFQTRESYTDYKIDSAPDAAFFDTTLPKGIVAMNDPSSADTPPVPLGQPAPDFNAKGLDGKTVSLKSLKGHVVLLDFWATWCGPCRKGLPETARFAEIGSPKGLKVLAVSAEDLKTISSFVSQQSYKLPAFSDGGQGEQAYKATAIPTVAVVDAQGNLSAYFVGLQDPQTIQDALKKAGMDLG
jgi:thiol-disulfide isomerase/thioredoxin